MKRATEASIGWRKKFGTMPIQKMSTTSGARIHFSRPLRSASFSFFSLFTGPQNILSTACSM